MKVHEVHGVHGVHEHHNSAHVVPVLDVIGVPLQDEPHDLLLIGHDSLVEWRVTIVIPSICPAFLVQQSPDKPESKMAINVSRKKCLRNYVPELPSNHLLMDCVDFFLRCEINDKIFLHVIFGHENFWRKVD